MGKPVPGYVGTSSSRIHRVKRRTGGTETSQYLQEKKTTVISRVAASEMERVQTVHMSSPKALYARCRGVWPEAVSDASGSYKTDG
jgi:hypothetical protein